MDIAERTETMNQDSFDDTFMKLFKDFVAYGFFNPEDPANKAKIDQNKGVRLTDNEAEYFLNEYGLMLVSVGREKQMDGKIFPLEINETFPHGTYNFEYDDDEIKVTFVPDKVFKQILKDDSVAATAATADFTPISEEEGKRRKETKVG